ncbi:MAG: hypothetical protein AVW06_03725 [Hadesarchaea archaeon DG-33-1]|nr:MAG: hypothetical protein AVW06_03725 [Hadesarchaea archaeon DG-33-1]
MLYVSMRGDGSLMVHPEILGEKEREITLKFEEEEKRERLTRRIISCYLNGYHRLNIVSKKVFTVEQQETIREIAAKLYLRIMKADSQEFVIESLLDMSKISLDMGARRMHTIVSSMCWDMLKALQQENPKLAKIISSLDEDVDRFSFLLLRMLRNAVQDPVVASHMKISFLDCLDYQTLIQQIERVADLVVNISNVLINTHPEKFHPPILERILSVGQKECRLYEDAVEAFFTKNVEEANRIIDSRDHIERMNLKLLEEMAKKEKRPSVLTPTCSIRVSFMQIYFCGAEVAKTIINQVIGRP